MGVAVAQLFTRHHQRQDHPGGLSTDHRQTQRCDEVCELHKSVQSLASAQLDYGQALHAVYAVVDDVRRDLLAARYTEIGGLHRAYMQMI